MRNESPSTERTWQNALQGKCFLVTYYMDGEFLSLHEDECFEFIFHYRGGVLSITHVSFIFRLVMWLLISIPSISLNEPSTFLHLLPAVKSTHNFIARLYRKPAGIKKIQY